MFDIAVCDDSELDRNLLIEEIRKCEKYRETVRFHQYSSGKELLAAMELARFSLIFLDIIFKLAVFLLPSTEVALIVTFPALIPFTTPAFVTVAIFLSEDDQVTFL